MTKTVKKRKLKVGRILLILVVLILLYLGFSLYAKLPIKNILVTKNRYLTDQEIIETAKIEEYPSFYWTSTSSMKRRLLANPLIQKVTIKRSFYHVLTIEITEYRPLFQKEVDRRVVTESKQEFLPENEILGIPKLLNYVPDTKYDSFIKGMSMMNESILGKISEIEYNPNEVDKDRFLLYMDDGNSVYLTLTKFDKINYYNEVLPKLEGKHGILYLDSGNHFQIME